ncbi:electron transfer flavoprotein beta subunit lysine methyltransferase-like isoform X2 [Armigeres subalbatus]|uniref:electron transfer flavoprotein beta subunit lysine methyltransferase-like isoform X2 n=1 Tax=Armigeres subalbatus TaxID=124917 RepID=UPI002ED50945
MFVCLLLFCTELKERFISEISSRSGLIAVRVWTLIELRRNGQRRKLTIAVPMANRYLSVVWRAVCVCLAFSERFSSANLTDRCKILQNTKTSRQHLTPELALHLITEECTIYHQPIDEDFCFAAEPFWGFFWPGGQALTRFILDNKQLFDGKSVLDVGSGCGASSIAALKSGAKHVTANDIDPVALQATLLNTELNVVGAPDSIVGQHCLRLELDQTNQIGTGCDRYDVILLGDLFYDAEIADVLIPWLSRLSRHGKKDIYIGDPGRHGLTETRLRNMIHQARYELPPNVCLENNGFSHASVWKFVEDA